MPLDGVQLMSYKWLLINIGVSALLMMGVPVYLLFQDNLLGAAIIAFPSGAILLLIFAISRNLAEPE